MKSIRQYLPHILLFFLLVFTCFVGYLLFAPKEKDILKVAFLDVGQGDAIYIEAPNGRQMLVDAGDGPIVLSKLSKVMPFGDRSIDMIVMTNPDKDHIGGFIDVLKRYKVNYVLESGTPKKTKTYLDLEGVIAKQNIKKDLAHKGMHVVLDEKKNIYFDILFPDRDVSKMSPNDGSIVGKLVYGSQSFMLMGDATKYTEYLIMEGGVNDLKAQVLKVGHHGSRTSTSRIFLEKVNPEVAIVSAGKNNRYGHPHKEVLELLSQMNVPYLGTYQKGTITLKTNGVKLFQ